MQCILALASIVLFQIEIKIYKDVVKTQFYPFNPNMSYHHITYYRIGTTTLSQF